MSVVRISFKDIFQNISLSWWLRISYNLSEMVPRACHDFVLGGCICNSKKHDGLEWSSSKVATEQGWVFSRKKTIFSFPVEKTGNIRKEMEISGKNYAWLVISQINVIKWYHSFAM